MADPNIKTVKIFNKASEEAEPEPQEPQEGGVKKRATRKKKFIISSVTVKKEGGGTHPGTIDQLASTRVPGSDNTKAVGTASILTQSGATVGAIAPSVASSSVGGAKVVLAKSRKKSSVILTGPKPVASSSHRKTAKKVHVNLKGLTRKVHKAKKIQTSSGATSLTDIKTDLVKAGLIKAETKAPESVIRQIYSDLMVLKKRAL